MKKQYLLSEIVIIFYLAAFKIIFHLILPEYGYFRDELYYISIGDQFSLSNLDMLPLSPLYLKIFTLIFGYSLKTLHLASSLLGAASLIFTCLITKELGGKKYAILLIGIFFIFSGTLPFGSLFSYDSIDFLVSISTLFFLVKLFKTDNPKLWLIIGLVLGFGLLNKLTILFFGFAILISLLLVPQRKMLCKYHIWIGGLIAIICLIPYTIWQAENNWYFVEFASNYSGGISYIASFLEFVWNQIFPNNIFAFPVWIIGLYLLLLSSKWKQYRFFGIMYLFLFLFYFIIGAKFYFLIPMYSPLLAVGTIKIEEMLSKMNKTKIAIPVIYILLSASFIPFMVPLLPVNYLVKYVGVLGTDAGVKYENQELNNLPQHFSDRFGWEELVSEISIVYNELPKEVKSNTGILTNNWGIASAIHFYRNKYNLPEPVSNSGWYYFETLKDNKNYENYICLGYDELYLKCIFDNVSLKRIFTHPYCIPHENNRPIYLCLNSIFNIKQFLKNERLTKHRFLSILENEGVDKAVQYYNDQKENKVYITEKLVNLLGYENLQRNHTKCAIRIFQFNAKIFPDSYNVYGSLAEAYLKNGQTDLAIKNYKKSLELNPNDENAKKILEKINKNN